MKHILSILAAGIMLLSGVTHLVAAEVDGSWNLVLNTEIGERQMPISLQTDGEEVSAKLGDIPLKGSFRDGKLSLRVKDYYVAEAGFKADLLIEGTITGDAIAGRWTFADYSGPLKGERATGAIHANGPKVDGTWDIVFATEVGDRPVRIKLASNGDAVSGMLGDQRMEGTFLNGALALKLPKFYSADAGHTADLTLQGTVDGDSLVGKWTFGEYSGPAKGQRSAQ